MANVSPIRTEEDYEAALARVSELMDALSCPDGQIEDENHPDRVELDVLVDLVELYESRHYPIGLPSPIAAIEFHMDQTGMTPRDLVPFIGSRAKVSEVLSGKRAITIVDGTGASPAPGHIRRHPAPGARRRFRLYVRRHRAKQVSFEGHGEVWVDSGSSRSG